MFRLAEYDAARRRRRRWRAQADKVELGNAAARGRMLDAGQVESEWSAVLRTVCAGMLAVPSRCGARLPHFSPHDIAEIEIEVRAVLTELGAGAKGE
jgi:phage terminase Nu1 subunit (DNA packaging protein)